MIITRRLNLLKQWVFGHKNGVSSAELAKNLFAPVSKYKARKFIREIREEGNYYIIYFAGIEKPLYYSKSERLEALNMVISEIFRPDEWHYYEIPQTKIDHDDIVLDCGAAEGLFTLTVAHRCRKVYAVEPLPEFVTSMQKTFKDFSNVEIIPAALSSKTSMGYLTTNGISSSISNTPTDTPVQITTIDELFFKQGKPLTYLKADLEGFELEMLAGAVETIRQNRPKIAITTYHKAEHAVEIEKFLRKIHPEYSILTKGLEERAGAPVMLHAW